MKNSQSCFPGFLMKKSTVTHYKIVASFACPSRKNPYSCPPSFTNFDLFFIQAFPRFLMIVIGDYPGLPGLYTAAVLAAALR